MYNVKLENLAGHPGTMVVQVYGCSVTVVVQVLQVVVLCPDELSLRYYIPNRHPTS